MRCYVSLIKSTLLCLWSENETYGSILSAFIFHIIKTSAQSEHVDAVITDFFSQRNMAI